MSLLEDKQKLIEEREKYSKWKGRIEGVSNNGMIGAKSFSNNSYSGHSYGESTSYLDKGRDNEKKKKTKKEETSDSEEEKKEKKKSKKVKQESSESSSEEEDKKNKKKKENEKVKKENEKEKKEETNIPTGVKLNAATSK